MWYSLALLSSGGVLFLLHYLVISFPFKHTNKLISLLMGLALIGMILSVSCFFMNRGLLELKNRKKYIWWMIVSAIAFTVYLGYLTFCIIERAHSVGMAF